MIIFLDPRDKLHTPQEIDSVLSAEFLDPDEEPELFQLFSKFMAHTPCGPANPIAPCMRNGKCSKGFPKILHPHMMTSCLLPRFLCPTLTWRIDDSQQTPFMQPFKSCKTVISHYASRILYILPVIVRLQMDFRYSDWHIPAYTSIVYFCILLYLYYLLFTNNY